MGIQERNKRLVTLRLPLAGEDLYVWAPGGTAIRGSLQPMTRTLNQATLRLESRVRGEHVERMMCLRYDGALRLEEGMGLCVDVGPGADCDYRIVGVERWPGHQRALLEYVPYRA